MYLVCCTESGAVNVPDLKAVLDWPCFYLISSQRMLAFYYKGGLAFLSSKMCALFDLQNSEILVLYITYTNVWPVRVDENETLSL
jgi:hypothetical protein